MKKIIIIALLMLFNNLIAQTDDIVDISNIKINNIIGFEASSSVLTNSLGNAQSVTTDYWEMEDQNITQYNYLGASFQFINDELKSFNINSPSYDVYIDGHIIKVGNNINSLQLFFSDSYAHKQNGFLSIGIDPNDYQYILITYDDSNGIITGIENRFY